MKKTRNGQRNSLLTGASIFAAAAAALTATPAMAQDDAAEEEEAIVVTGTRITSPGVQSSAPITTIGAEEIQLQGEATVERVLSALPAVQSVDNQGVNNGTAGANTISLRGLGSQRNLVMIDGRRMVPFGATGQVDLQQIPPAFVERIDVITGGASAVYGSDAISGAINFVMQRDFEGVEFDYDRSITGEQDGEINTGSLSFGANLADGRGNVAVNVTYSERSGVQLGARPLGQIGIVTATGGGYADFLAGNAPLPPADPLCGGTGAVDLTSGGSPATLPTRVSLVGGAAFFPEGQFRTDGSFGANCSVFNFNPFNYYQTPSERFGITALAHYEINPNVEAYTRLTFSDTSVRQQVAPSGLFNNQMFINLDNAFIDPAVRATFLANANAAFAGGALCETPTNTCAVANWVDQTGDGVTSDDDILLGVRRRTVEFGARSTEYNADTFQVAVGLRGQIGDSDWDYDTYFSHGRVNTIRVSSGYTNLATIRQQVLTTDGVTCRDTPAPCVPLNLFGPPITDPGAITYGSAVALARRYTEQTVASANVAGELPWGTPWAANNIAMSVGAEWRQERAEIVPDECLKLPPVSCLGGGGGTTLPLAGEYDVHEWFGEMIIPLFEDQPFARSLDIELGYRQSDYNLTGVNETYKYGVNWELFDGLRFRAMRQQAARAPNVSELFQPIVTGLANSASFDPCSVAQPPAGRTLALRAICEAAGTGMTPGQVWAVPDGVVAGQISGFFGTQPAALPSPETAETTTIGLVWTPDFGMDWLSNVVLSFDYYNIEIEDFIGVFGPDEILQGCYVQNITSLCDTVVRIGGDLTLDGAGLQFFTTNLMRAQAEGYEFSAQAGVDMGGLGSLDFALAVNQYTTNEFQSAAFLAPIDCMGFYGPQCGNPLPEFRWTQRTSWEIGDFQFAYLWRHLGESSIEPIVAAGTFPAFRTIEAYDYFDLTATWDVTDWARLNVGVRNVTEEEPPVVGNEAGTTATNSGNTFPGIYDTMGRVYTMGFNVRF